MEIPLTLAADSFRDCRPLPAPHLDRKINWSFHLLDVYIMRYTAPRGQWGKTLHAGRRPSRCVRGARPHVPVLTPSSSFSFIFRRRDPSPPLIVSDGEQDVHGLLPPCRPKPPPQPAFRARAQWQGRLTFSWFSFSPLHARHWPSLRPPVERSKQAEPSGPQSGTHDDTRLRL